MPRRPRPVDPDAGPLQAFAHDLRELREKAGNPTYRVMAKRAGYSATTLSEAAGGVRRPSLDVTLAYVGVCGGDLNTWRLRWHDLSAAAAVQAARTQSDETPAQPPPSGPPAAPRPVPRPALLRWALLAAAVALVAVVGVVLGLRALGSGDSAAGGCPPAPAAAAAVFTGQTYQFTRVRSAPALHATVLRNIPADCTVGFTGFCLGDTVVDPTAGTLDTRWFMVPGGGFVASAIIHGNPPDALGPSECAGGSARPSTIKLTVESAGIGDRGQTLDATGVGIRIVGFAALYADNSNEVSWHQIGFTGPVAARFALTWRPDLLPRWPAEGLTVAAVACLGGDGPTGVVDARVVRRDAPGRAAAARLPRETLDAATRAACQYPDNAEQRPSIRQTIRRGLSMVTVARLGRRSPAEPYPPSI